MNQALKMDFRRTTALLECLIINIISYIIWKTLFFRGWNLVMQLDAMPRGWHCQPMIGVLMQFNLKLYPPPFPVLMLPRDPFCSGEVLGSLGGPRGRAFHVKRNPHPIVGESPNPWWQENSGNCSPNKKKMFRLWVTLVTTCLPSMYPYLFTWRIFLDIFLVSFKERAFSSHWNCRLTSFPSTIIGYWEQNHPIWISYLDFK